MNPAPRSFFRFVPLLFAAALTAAAADVKTLVKDLAPIPGATGNEQALAAKIAGFLPKTSALSTDNLGSLYLRTGPPGPGPALLAPMDEFGYVVSGFTPDGYLRLDRAVPPPSPIYDSFLLGHPVVISTPAGPVYGVVSQPAMHLLTRERRDQLAKELTLDLIFVDLGLRSEAEARSKGIDILDAVTFWPELSILAHDLWAGPGLGRKAACAALAEAARSLAGDKDAAADLAWLAQGRFPARGTRASLGAARAKERLALKTAILLDAVPADRGPASPLLGKGLAVLQAKDAPSRVREALDAAALEKHITLQYRAGVESPLLTPFLSDGGDALILGLPVRYAGTPSEIIDLKDVQALADLIIEIVKGGRLK